MNLSHRVTECDSVSMVASDSEAISKPSQTLDREISPNKRLKTLGKSKIEEPEIELNEHQSQGDSSSSSSSPPQSMDSDTKTCGICLSEEGKSIRGFIDSCDHHFCFVCIMEWAKVETRCPLCKCRFSTIRRPHKDGVFASDRIVNVPVRNQAYHYLGITTISDFDPYAEVQCVVCHSTADESLLLLCDLCDSAAHTYCVGLGATVPEGDWFCADCTVSRVDHANTEIDTDCVDQNMSECHVMPSAQSHVSIFDIVREPIIPDRERPPIVASPHPDHLSSLPNEAAEPGTRTVHNLADRVGVSNARTLRRCRNVHGRIRTLRENWNALRGGQLSFSSGTVDCDGKSNRKLNVGAGHSNRAGHQHSLSTTTCQQLASQVSCSAGPILNRGAQDIKKAWKLMDIAKSIHQMRKRTTIVHQPTTFTFSKGNMPRDLSHMKSNFPIARSQPVRARELGSIAKDNRCLSLGLGSEKQISQNYEKQKQCRVPAKEALKSNESLPTTHSERHSELPCSSKIHTIVHNDTCTGNVVDERGGNARLTSAVGSLIGASDLFHLKPELCATSSCTSDAPQGNGMVKNGYSQSKTRKDNTAKSEIQSLVKLNLKLLNRNNNLGVDEFKEIARLSTHCIMAACGVEHPKPGIPSFPTSVCCHSEQIQKLRKSTLMPSSCRECFYVFVKDVVNSILLEKAGHGSIILRLS